MILKLKGFFNLSDKNIPSLISINNLSLKISNQILDECIYNFCNYKQEIEFYFSYDDIDYIKNIEEMILKEYNCYVDYDKRVIKLILNELKNINIKEIIGKYEEEKEMMNIDNYENFRKKIKEIDNDDIKFNINKISINKNDENVINENINENNFMENSMDNVEIGENNSKIGNIFTHVSEKTEEIKLETYSELNANMNKIKRPYIKISDINNELEYNKENINYLDKIQNQKVKKEMNKLISEGASLMKKSSKINSLNQFNINGLYLTLIKNGEKYGNNYNLRLNKLILNIDIENEFLSDYNQIIFNNYINILDKVTKDKNNNELELNDYTYIILTYISQIENEINRINQKQNKIKKTRRFPMPIISESFTVNTLGNTDIINITKHVQNCVYKHELKDALVCVSIQGSTSAVTTIEYEDGLVQDLKETLERIAPSGKEYHHDEIWHDGNGYAHVRSAVVGTSTCIGLVDGVLNLGTWQQIVLLDFDNKPRLRNITVQIIA